MKPLIGGRNCFLINSKSYENEKGSQNLRPFSIYLNCLFLKFRKQFSLGQRNLIFPK